MVSRAGKWLLSLSGMALAANASAAPAFDLRPCGDEAAMAAALMGTVPANRTPPRHHAQFAEHAPAPFYAP